MSNYGRESIETLGKGEYEQPEYDGESFAEEVAAGVIIPDTGRYPPERWERGTDRGTDDE